MRTVSRLMLVAMMLVGLASCAEVLIASYGVYEWSKASPPPEPPPKPGDESSSGQ